MAIKQILDNIPGPTQEDGNTDGSQRQHVEKLLIKINKCFVDIILPAVFEVQEDLQQAGFWNQLNVGQSSVLSSGKPNIRNVELFFYPERIQQLPFESSALERTYRASFEPSADLRKIVMQIRFPQRLSPVKDDKKEIVPLGAIDTRTVDRFLEEFILGSVKVYKSDHILT